MKLLIICFLYFIKVASLQRICEAEDSYPWSYHGSENGPSHWGELFPSCDQAGQAPTPILEKNTYSAFTELEFRGFDVPVTGAKIENLGWTVRITPTDNYRRTMKLVSAIYELQNFQFRFGNESHPGSENVVNDVRYTMEIQFNMIAKDRGWEDASATLSALVEVCDNDTFAFAQITEALANVTYKGDVAELEYFFLYLFLPEMTGNAYAFYYYNGFNSTPPCEPLQAWVILQDIGYIGRNQMEYFDNLYSVGKDDASEDCKMAPNYRPLQGDRNQPVMTAQYYYTKQSSEY